jgi:hypothetical protein
MQREIFEDLWQRAKEMKKVGLKGEMVLLE